jgi:uncharacterized protein
MENSETQTNLPNLSAEAIRVLGVLIEKSKTTPDNYPLTLNSLTLGCNQKSSRFPVVDYDENTVLEALNDLKKVGLSQTIIGDGRSTKFRHSISVNYSLDPMEQSILCLLFLRGPLTAGEIRSNAGRLYDFDSLTEVQEGLNQLASADTFFVIQLERQSGKKEVRYAHTFAPVPEFDTTIQIVENHSVGLKERVQELEEKVAGLEEKLLILWKELKE